MNYDRISLYLSIGCAFFLAWYFRDLLAQAEAVEMRDCLYRVTVTNAYLVSKIIEK